MQSLPAKRSMIIGDQKQLDVLVPFQCVFGIYAHFSANCAFAVLSAAGTAAFSAAAFGILFVAAACCGSKAAACLSGTKALVKECDGSAVTAGNLEQYRDVEVYLSFM